MGTVGDDFGPYALWMDECNIDRSHVTVVDGTFTGQAFVTTDLDDNQITAFHPGAMNFSHQNRVGDVEDIALGIVAPDGKEGMSAHVEQFAQADIPFMFDPGQAMPLFSGPELLAMIDKARCVAVNDYEGQLLAERTGLSFVALAERVEALIVTLGADGSVIHAGGVTYAVPAAKPSAVLDPTGCGDAYRAGILYGMSRGWDWEKTGGLASVMGSLKIASRGGQNHVVNRETVGALYFETFGSHVF